MLTKLTFAFLLLFFASADLQAESIIFARTTPIGSNNFTQLFSMDIETGIINNLSADYNSDSMTVPGVFGQAPMVAVAGNVIIELVVPRNGLKGTYYDGHGTVVMTRFGFKAFDYDSTPPIQSSDLILHPHGERASYYSRSPSDPSIMIYTWPMLHTLPGRGRVLDLTDRRLLHKIPLSPILHGCFINGLQWNPGGDKLLFNLSYGDVHVTPEECAKWEGIYEINEDGSELKKLDFPPIKPGWSMRLVAVLDDTHALMMAVGPELYLFDRNQSAAQDHGYTSLAKKIQQRVIVSNDRRFVAYTTVKYGWQEGQEGCDSITVWIRELLKSSQPKLIKRFCSSMNDNRTVSLVGWFSRE